MDSTELCYLSLERVSVLIKSKDITPVEATRAVLDRINDVDRDLNSFITVMRDQALAQAQAAEREILHGHYRGPLHGIPVAVKDLYYTKGIRTTGGSAILANFVPDYSATAVARLETSGAVLVGKLNMHEFARGATTTSSLTGPCANPWDPDRVPGGSSGGSAAALSAGLCFGALGSDSGGSIRIPAALCGVVGLKPTFGRVSRRGMLPLSFSMDHAGPMARTVLDTALILGVIAGRDTNDSASEGVPVPDYAAALTGDIKGTRLRVPRDLFFERLDPEVESAVRSAMSTLEGLGAHLEDVAMPLVKYSAAAGRLISATEGGAVHEPYLRREAAKYSPDVRIASLVGQFVLGKHYIKAQRVRSLLRHEMAVALSGADALITPTVPIPAPTIVATLGTGAPKSDITSQLISFTRPANLTGFPAISLPCGYTRDELPIGLQIIGRPFDEATVMRIAYAYEQSTPWHRRRPNRVPSAPSVHPT
jgi:aspartyl-tRNA(Asn)/glutamyl-tRNA(Gln) amidotransferase subunit A